MFYYWIFLFLCFKEKVIQVIKYGDKELSPFLFMEYITVSEQEQDIYLPFVGNSH